MKKLINISIFSCFIFSSCKEYEFPQRAYSPQEIEQNNKKFPGFTFDHYRIRPTPDVRIDSSHMPFAIEGLERIETDSTIRYISLH